MGKCTKYCNISVMPNCNCFYNHLLTICAVFCPFAQFINNIKSRLYLDINKMIFDFRLGNIHYESTYIDGQEVQLVKHFKYMGIKIFVKRYNSLEIVHQ